MSHVAYSADSVSLFGDIYLRDDEQLHWKAGMLEFNFQLTEVRNPSISRGLHATKVNNKAWYGGLLLEHPPAARQGSV